MINDSGYFYNHSKGVLIYLIDKKDNRKFAFFKNIPDEYNRYEDDHEQYAFKTYNQEDKQIDTIQTGLPMNILQIILMECDTKIPTTVPNYKLFSEEEKDNMRSYVGRLPEDEDRGGEEMTVSDELPGLGRPMTVVPRLRRLARLVPMPDLEPVIEKISQDYCDGFGIPLTEENNDVLIRLTVDLAKQLNDLHDELP